MKEIGCPVCQEHIKVKTAKGRKSNKPFIMLVCPVDGRHFRGFITDQGYIRQVIGDREGDLGSGRG